MRYSPITAVALCIALSPLALRASAADPAGPPADFARIDGRTLILDNGAVRRIVAFSPGGALSTISLRLPDQAEDFVTNETAAINGGPGDNLPDVPTTHLRRGPNSAEFSFSANGAGYTGTSAWELLGMETGIRDGAGQGAVVRLVTHGGPAPQLRVEISYLLYPGLPVIRKKIRFINNSANPVRLESVDVEQLNPSWRAIENTAHQSYGRYRHVGPFIGGWDDSVVVAHDERSARGLVLGTEAPGVMKRISTFADGRSVTAGLTHANETYPFRKWLGAGEAWESTWSFVAPYASADPSSPLNTLVPDFVRRHLGVRLAQTATRPTFVYNTWAPFRKAIDAKLIGELADAAAACGVKEFVIDDGWAERYGDWQIDRKKFPEGLKPVFDHIKALGMKPGLWLAIASASRDSEVFRLHPDWFVHDAADQPVDLHQGSGKFATACLSTGWKDYIRDVILGLVRQYGLQYVKLDLSMVTSAYFFDTSVTGCSAHNHPHHDRAESLLQTYQRAWELFDELHAAAPDLFIDCTFETMGAAQLIDLDMCKHAEGNWLTNFYDDPPAGSLRVRQMAWWRSGIIPAGALVIGNQKIDAAGSQLSFQSLTGTLPIMLGDPRKLGERERAGYRQWGDWFQATESRHSVMLFRQDLAGFGEPSESGWDGFQRINTESHSGGIVGVFRNASADSARTIFVRGLDPSRHYRVERAPTGEILTTLTGQALEESGFRVELPARDSAELFQITAAPPMAAESRTPEIR